jgi:hypothetical protein
MDPNKNINVVNFATNIDKECDYCHEKKWVVGVIGNIHICLDCIESFRQTISDRLHRESTMRLINEREK